MWASCGRRVSREQQEQFGRRIAGTPRGVCLQGADHGEALEARPCAVLARSIVETSSASPLVEPYRAYHSAQWLLIYQLLRSMSAAAAAS